MWLQLISLLFFVVVVSGQICTDDTLIFQSSGNLVACNDFYLPNTQFKVPICGYDIFRGTQQKVQLHITSNSNYGLGLMTSPDRSISTTGFLQIDVTSLRQGSNPKLMMGSLSTGTSFSLYGSNTAGAIGTLLYSSQTINAYIDFNGINSYQYISITSGGSDSSVVLQNIHIGCSPITATPTAAPSSLGIFSKLIFATASSTTSLTGCRSFLLPLTNLALPLCGYQVSSNNVISGVDISVSTIGLGLTIDASLGIGSTSFVQIDLEQLTNTADVSLLVGTTQTTSSIEVDLSILGSALKFLLPSRRLTTLHHNTNINTDEDLQALLHDRDVIHDPIEHRDLAVATEFYIFGTNIQGDVGDLLAAPSITGDYISISAYVGTYKYISISTSSANVYIQGLSLIDLSTIGTLPVNTKIDTTIFQGPTYGLSLGVTNTFGFPNLPIQIGVQGYVSTSTGTIQASAMTAGPYGLGLAARADGSLSVDGFVQLDISGITANMNAKIMMGATASTGLMEDRSQYDILGDVTVLNGFTFQSDSHTAILPKYVFAGSNEQGTLGTGLVVDETYASYISLPGVGTYKYISVLPIIQDSQSYASIYFQGIQVQYNVTLTASSPTMEPTPISQNPHADICLFQGIARGYNLGYANAFYFPNAQIQIGVIGFIYNSTSNAFVTTNLSAGPFGLGLVASLDGGITTTGFIQIDVSQVQSWMSPQILVGSTGVSGLTDLHDYVNIAGQYTYLNGYTYASSAYDAAPTFAFYGSNTLGTAGVHLGTYSTLGTYMDLPGFGAYTYISLQPIPDQFSSTVYIQEMKVYGYFGNFPTNEPTAAPTQRVNSVSNGAATPVSSPTTTKPTYIPTFAPTTCTPDNLSFQLPSDTANAPTNTCNQYQFSNGLNELTVCNYNENDQPTTMTIDQYGIVIGTGYIQLDLSTVPVACYPRMLFDSASGQLQFTMYGSNSSGTKGVPLVTDTADGHIVEIPTDQKVQYVSIALANNNRRILRLLQNDSLYAQGMIVGQPHTYASNTATNAPVYTAGVVEQKPGGGDTLTESMLLGIVLGIVALILILLMWLIYFCLIIQRKRGSERTLEDWISSGEGNIDVYKKSPVTKAEAVDDKISPRLEYEARSSLFGGANPMSNDYQQLSMDISDSPIKEKSKSKFGFMGSFRSKSKDIDAPSPQYAELKSRSDSTGSYTNPMMMLGSGHKRNSSMSSNTTSPYNRASPSPTIYSLQGNPWAAANPLARPHSPNKSVRNSQESSASTDINDDPWGVKDLLVTNTKQQSSSSSSSNKNRKDSQPNQSVDEDDDMSVSSGTHLNTEFNDSPSLYPATNPYKPNAGRQKSPSMADRKKMMTTQPTASSTSSTTAASVITITTASAKKNKEKDTTPVWEHAANRPSESFDMSNPFHINTTKAVAPGDITSVQSTTTTTTTLKVPSITTPSINSPPSVDIPTVNPSSSSSSSSSSGDGSASARIASVFSPLNPFSRSRTNSKASINNDTAPPTVDTTSTTASEDKSSTGAGSKSPQVKAAFSPLDFKNIKLKSASGGESTTIDFGNGTSASTTANNSETEAPSAPPKSPATKGPGSPNPFLRRKPPLQAADSPTLKPTQTVTGDGKVTAPMGGVKVTSGEEWDEKIKQKTTKDKYSWLSDE